jgi:phage terminase Nu1 subunit (DNA packaging protein)
LLHLRDFLKWRLSCEDSSPLEKEPTRLTKAQADHEELNVAQARSKLIPSDVLVMMWQAKKANAKTRLLALPPRMAQPAIDARNINEIEDHVRDLLYEALDELSRDGLPEDVRTHLERRSECMEVRATPDDQAVGGHKIKAKPRRQRRARTA